LKWPVRSLAWLDDVEERRATQRRSVTAKNSSFASRFKTKCAARAKNMKSRSAAAPASRRSVNARLSRVLQT
jgi:hypothetical protein